MNTTHGLYIRLIGVLMALLSWYAYLLYRGKLSLFVNPRLHLFTFLMLGSIGLIIFYAILMFEEAPPIVHYSTKGTVALVFVMVSLLPAYDAHLDPNILPVADIGTLQRNIRTAQSQNGLAGDIIRGDIGSFEDTTFVISPFDRDELGYILLTQIGYYGTIVDMYTHIDHYEGEKIRASGVVFKAHDDKENEFGVGLYYMTCCAADAQLVGLRYTTQFDVPHVGKWVEVVGTITKDHDNQPVIVVEDLLFIPPLDDPFMYY